MPNVIRRVFRATKRRIKKGQREHRTYNLHQAARRLLAQADYEEVTVAAIAKEAGVSVGAFYGRFSSKNTFLYSVIADRCQEAKEHADRELSPQSWRRHKPVEVVRAIIEQIVRTLHGPGSGIFRAALKRGHLDPTNLRPVNEYRAVVTERAISLLAHRLQGIPDPSHTVRSVVQMVQATGLDALLYDVGVLRAGRRKMVDMMVAVTARGLGISAPTVKKEDNEADHAATDLMIDIPHEDVEAVPIMRTSPKPPSRRRRGFTGTEPSKAPVTVRPTSTPAARPPGLDSASPRGRITRL